MFRPKSESEYKIGQFRGHIYRHALLVWIAFASIYQLNINILRFSECSVFESTFILLSPQIGQYFCFSNDEISFSVNFKRGKAILQQMLFC